ncbi:hypothetical protein ACE1B6_06025 [Aerosakkonemataceae cyanobacterium BLCC-F154]|uniref:YegS/DAGK C-terminal domain-containing protein n=1 Tax=Floridaenema fluviatile BLCC-F154 TaxID=3153640 RepID=A0ABV4Y7S2_9CYAN
MSRRALLLINRFSRRGQESFFEAVKQLQQNFELLEASTEQPRQISHLIRQYRHQVDLVVVGGGMVVDDDATIEDCKLDLYSLETRHWGQIFRLFPAIIRGKQGNLPGVRTLSGQEMEIHTGKPYPINTDGKIITYTPAKFQVTPEALPVIVPLA